ncbi:MAG: iron ABC transporter permease [Rhodospirillaceae bacterium]|nr:iron ABC transporter permease [Rhodospirillaceae bacterium]
MALAIVFLFVVGLCIGPVLIPLNHVVDSLFATDNAPFTVIMQEIRLPRAILGGVVGASLGLSGAALQGLLRNPLAEPGLIGASSSAALGAVIALYYGFSTLSPLALPVFAIVGAVLSILALFALTGRDPGVMSIILAGVALTSLTGALISIAINMSPDPHSALEIVFWMMGSLSDRSMQHVILALPFTVIGWAMMMSCGRALDALTLGEETAASLGISLSRLRFRLIVGTAFAVGAGVAVAGSIGFVGLVVPHLLRPLVGYRPSRLLMASALGGAVLLLAADVGVRLLPVDPEFKLGVLTSVVGAPFFLALVLKTRHRTL